MSRSDEIIGTAVPAFGRGERGIKGGSSAKRSGYSRGKNRAIDSGGGFSLAARWFPDQGFGTKGGKFIRFDPGTL